MCVLCIVCMLGCGCWHGAIGGHKGIFGNNLRMCMKKCIHLAFFVNVVCLSKFVCLHCPTCQPCLCVTESVSSYNIVI